MCAKPTTDVEYLTADPPTGLPFSEAVRVGHMLYLSGQLGTDPSLKVVPGGIEAETRQTMENIRAVLERDLAHPSNIAVVEEQVEPICESVLAFDYALMSLPKSYTPKAPSSPAS